MQIYKTIKTINGTMDITFPCFFRKHDKRTGQTDFECYISESHGYTIEFPKVGLPSFKPTQNNFWQTAGTLCTPIDYTAFDRARFAANLMIAEAITNAMQPSIEGLDHFGEWQADNHNTEDEADRPAPEMITDIVVHERVNNAPMRLHDRLKITQTA